MSTSEAIGSGVLEIGPRGHGFLRDPKRSFKPQPLDPRVSEALIHSASLRTGVWVEGPLNPGKPPEPPSLASLTTIEGVAPEVYARTPRFEDLSAVDPSRRIHLETGQEPLGTRVIDLFTPVGKGQRGLIVAPPRSGKTILLQQIANAIATNHPEITLFVLLVDERPEEVTEMKRSIKGQVVAASSDQSSEDQIRLAQLTLERARRLVERGRDVLILLDSLTRLARAYNKGSNTGRTMSGGVDIKALDVPKRLFGAARAFDEGGSLTILATCLIETGSRMDEVIFQEFKGTGNMELVLDRKLAERRVWPAIDLALSGTRKEERLLDPESLRRVVLVRRTLADAKPVEAIEALLKQMGKQPDNAAFLDFIADPTRKKP